MANQIEEILKLAQLAHEATLFKILIHEKAKEYGSFTMSEVAMLDTMFNAGSELTDNENTD